MKHVEMKKEVDVVGYIGLKLSLHHPLNELRNVRKEGNGSEVASDGFLDLTIGCSHLRVFRGNRILQEVRWAMRM